MIVVFGSVNIDLVAQVERIAAPGETVIGPSYAVIAGGKGANQALAARRAGAAVAMAGAVGWDSFADAALVHLKGEGVDLSAMAVVDAPTGAAFIAVDQHGRNAITVAAGANGLAKAEQICSLDLKAGDYLLLQREVPDAEAQSAAAMARRAGAKVILNAAPGGAISPHYIALVDILILNEHEAELLRKSFGLAGPGFAEVARLAASHGCAATIVTLGAQGLLAWHGGKELALPAFAVEVVDTTAAGDAFAGAMAAALDSGAELADALRHGLAAGSLACTKPGAQPSLPAQAEIAALLARRTQ